MQTLTGIYRSVDAARAAAGDLHEAGIASDAIALRVSGVADAPPARSAQQSERIGRQAGAFAADVGKTAAAFVPFVGTEIADSKLSRALHDASESAGAAAGRVVDALAGGALSEESEAGSEGRVSISVRVESSREAEIREILARAGAVRISGAG